MTDRSPEHFEPARRVSYAEAFFTGGNWLAVIGTAIMIGVALLWAPAVFLSSHSDQEVAAINMWPLVLVICPLAFWGLLSISRSIEQSYEDELARSSMRHRHEN